MRFLDQLSKLFVNRPRVAPHQPIDYAAMPNPDGPVSRIPLYVRIYVPGSRTPVHVLPVHEVLTTDYKAAKFDGGFVVEPEQEGAVYFCCILPPVHVDKSHAKSEASPAEVRPEGKILKLRGERVPNYEDAIGV